MIIKVKHTTNYNYTEMILRNQQIIRLRPFTNSHQKVIQWDISAPKKLQDYIGWFGNQCSLLEIEKEDRLQNIIIEASGIVETYPNWTNSEIGFIPLSHYLMQTNFTQPSPALIEFINLFAIANQYLIDKQLFDEFFDLLSQLILHKVPYKTGVTSVKSTVSQVFDIGGGVCQDHTHLMLSCARQLNFPARYVSGYIYTIDTTHVESHAWAEVWYNNAWHSFDVSNQCRALENHIILAYGGDYSSASPIRGSRIGGGVETLNTYASVFV